MSCEPFLAIQMPSKNIYYSDKYYDDKYEYRHVMLPKDLAKLVPRTHLMSEAEWRNLGVQQSQVRRRKRAGGWVRLTLPNIDYVVKNKNVTIV